MPQLLIIKPQVDGLPFLRKSGHGRPMQVKRSIWAVFVARHPRQMSCSGSLRGCGKFGLVKYRRTWERMGSGGLRGPQNRCEACKTSWMCSIHIRSRHTLPALLCSRSCCVPQRRCFVLHTLTTTWGRRLCGGFEHGRETALKHANRTSCPQKRFYLHRNQNETSAHRLMRNFAATVRYYPYTIKLAAHRVPRPTFFVSHHWRKHELHAESSRRAQGPLSRAA